MAIGVLDDISFMPQFSVAVFQPLDWTVLGVYLGVLLVLSVYFSRRKQANTTDYFLAGRRIPVWAAAMSLMATALSGATFVGVPAQSYSGNLTYLWSYAGQVMAAVVVAFLFVPKFYRLNVTTVYELLDTRCGRHARRTASAMFMVGRVLASGARLYIASLAAALALFGDTTMQSVVWAIVILMLIGICYTLVGGMEAVIWTDVIQAVFFVGAAVVAVVILLHKIPVGYGEVLSALREPDDGQPPKLTVFLWGTEGYGRAYAYTLMTAILGHSLIGIGAFGTDQDMTQRLLTCKDAKSAGKAALSGVLMSVPVATLFLVVGLLLYVYYQRPDIMGAESVVAPEQAREVFLRFIIDELPAGVTGLMMAGLFAATLSSTNSELNAMSSTLVCDFYRPMRPGHGEGHYVAAGRWGVALWGLTLGGFAILGAYWHQHRSDTLIDFALGVMSFAYSGLVGVFLTLLLTKRGNTFSVIASLATGFIVVLVLQIQPWAGWGYEEIDLAFPWHMTLATSLAFVVCCMGRPVGRDLQRNSNASTLSQ